VTRLETHRLARVGPVVWSLALLLLLAACSINPLESAPPAGFDLSGNWLLEGDLSDVERSRETSLRSGFVTQDYPLLVARKLSIEQDVRSMGIEFEHGSYRDVTWGERKRGIWWVRAGWHEGDLHIYSDASDTSAVEVYRLLDDGQRLLIDIEVQAGSGTQRFNRVFVREAEL
jgi:hypothetical protein